MWELINKGSNRYKGAKVKREFKRNLCHSEERGIPASSSTKTVDKDCGVTYGDSSFLGMTRLCQSHSIRK